MEPPHSLWWSTLDAPFVTPRKPTLRSPSRRRRRHYRWRIHRTVDRAGVKADAIRPPCRSRSSRRRSADLARRAATAAGPHRSIPSPTRPGHRAPRPRARLRSPTCRHQLQHLAFAPWVGPSPSTASTPTSYRAVPSTFARSRASSRSAPAPRARVRPSRLDTAAEISSWLDEDEVHDRAHVGGSARCAHSPHCATSPGSVSARSGYGE